MSADFDKAIDRAVREMLDAEPPDGLRERVLQRIEAPRRALKWMWIAVPVAAAAMLALAVLRPGLEPVATPRTGGDYRLSADASADIQPVPDTGAPQAQSTSRAARPQTGGDEPSQAEDEHRVPPLAGPPPIALQTIADGTATPVEAIGVAPLAVPALEVNPLADAPQERREE
jgi:hypothetical protein